MLEIRAPGKGMEGGVGWGGSAEGRKDVVAPLSLL